MISVGTEMGPHCWHWSHSSTAANENLEECCNCDKIVKWEDRWRQDNGQCEWETYG